MQRKLDRITIGIIERAGAYIPSENPASRNCLSSLAVLKSMPHTVRGKWLLGFNIHPSFVDVSGPISGIFERDEKEGVAETEISILESMAFSLTI
jgi:hypothetical protein